VNLQLVQTGRLHTIVDSILLLVQASVGIFILMSRKLFDTRIYENSDEGDEHIEFINSRWYGLWHICGTKEVFSGNEFKEMEVCTKWNEPIRGIWTPSSFWDNPKPMGTYYMVTCF